MSKEKDDPEELDLIRQKLQTLLLLRHGTLGFVSTLIESEYKLFFDDSPPCNWSMIVKSSQVALTKSRGSTIIKGNPVEDDVAKNWIHKIFGRASSPGSGVNEDKLQCLLLLKFGASGCNLNAMGCVCKKYFGQDPFYNQDSSKKWMRFFKLNSTKLITFNSNTIKMVRGEQLEFDQAKKYLQLIFPHHDHKNLKKSILRPLPLPVKHSSTELEKLPKAGPSGINSNFVPNPPLPNPVVSVGNTENFTGHNLSVETSPSKQCSNISITISMPPTWCHSHNGTVTREVVSANQGQPPVVVTSNPKRPSSICSAVSDATLPVTSHSRPLRSLPRLLSERELADDEEEGKEHQKSKRPRTSSLSESLNSTDMESNTLLLKKSTPSSVNKDGQYFPEMGQLVPLGRKFLLNSSNFQLTRKAYRKSPTSSPTQPITSHRNNLDAEKKDRSTIFIVAPISHVIEVFGNEAEFIRQLHKFLEKNYGRVIQPRIINGSFRATIEVPNARRVIEIMEEKYINFYSARFRVYLDRKR